MADLNGAVLALYTDFLENLQVAGAAGRSAEFEAIATRSPAYLIRSRGVTIIERDRNFQGVTTEGEWVPVRARQVLSSLKRVTPGSGFVRCRRRRSSSDRHGSIGGSGFDSA